MTKRAHRPFAGGDRLVTALLALAAVGLGGCAGLRLNLVDASVQGPSNVAVYFTVDTNRGEAVPGLTADQFDIFEDGRLVSTFESQQTILNPEVATVRYTLLLLDMSGSVVESGQIPLIEQGVAAFVESVGEQEQLAIHAFDGRAELVPIVEFDASAGRLAARSARLSSIRSEDPSTNLHGAIVEASRVLAEAMAASDVPLRFGTLVVFTDGTDRAHRATAGDALRAVRDADLSIWVIGLGGEVDQQELERFGRDGFVHVGDQDAVVQAFQGVAERIQSLASRFYLLSYCSPARAGRHRLEVQARHGDLTGRLSYEFDAEGFQPGCDPATPPAFAVPGTSPPPRPRARPAPAARQAPPPAEASGSAVIDAGDWE